VLTLAAAFVENLVYVDKCSLWVELPGETIESESCVIVAGDSEGEELVSPILKRASDAYDEYRVGLIQAYPWSRQPAKDPKKHTHTQNPYIH
jgi:hypothetical protein